MTWTPVQKLSIGAGTALLVLALFGVTAVYALARMSQQQADVTHVNEAIANIDQLVGSMAEAERAGTDFIMSGAEESAEAFSTARIRVEELIRALEGSSEDRPRQRAALDSIGFIVGQRFRAFILGTELRRRGGASATAAFVRNDSLRASSPALRRLAQRMRDEELRVLAETTRLQSGSGRTASFVIVSGSVIAFVLAAAAFTPIRPSVAARLTRRLTTPVGAAGIPELGAGVQDAARLASDRLSRLQQLAYALDASRGVEAVADAVITRGLGGTHTSAVIVAMVDNGTWRVVSRRPAHANPAAELAPAAAKPLADAARANEPVIVERQVERDAMYPEFPIVGAGEEVAFLAVPITASGRAMGGILLTFDGPRVFGDDDRAYFATLGRMAGQAMGKQNSE